MIVIGSDLVERYIRTRAGHKGIKVARTQYAAWLDIALHARWRHPEDVSVPPEGKYLEAWAGGVQHQGQ
jgi:hypothetical protein